MIRMFYKETFFNRLYYAVRGSELTELNLPNNDGPKIIIRLLQSLKKSQL
jgi:hypothetical protein